MEASDKNRAVLLAVEAEQKQNDNTFLEQHFVQEDSYTSQGYPTERSPVILTSTSTGKSINADILDPSKDQNIKFGKMSDRQKYVLVLCCFTYFLEGVAFSIIAPFFPTIAMKKGMSLVLTGLVFSGFQLVTFVTSPLFGANMSRLGPKFVVLSGVFLAGSCTILFGFLDRCPPGNLFIVLAFACRTIEALGYTAYYTGLLTFITTEFPNDISTTFSIMQSVNGIGMMIGPALGGALYELGGYELPFVLTGGIVLLNMLFFWKLIPDTTPKHEVKNKTSQLSMLRSPTVLISMVAIIFATSARNFPNPILSPYLKTFGLTEGIIGLIFVVPMLFYTGFCPLWGYLTDKKHLTLYLIVIGYFLFGIGYLLMGPSIIIPFLPSSVWTVVIGLVFSGTFFGCVYLPCFKLMQIGAVTMGLEKDSIETMSMISGLSSAGYSLGAFIGTITSGALADNLGYRNAFAAVGMTNIIMSAILLAYFIIRSNHLNQYVKQI